MARILVHLPLNISRTLEEMLKAYGKEMGKRHEISLEIMRYQCGENNSCENSKDKEIPDIIIGHIDYFSKHSNKFLKEHFMPLPDHFPMRDELKNAGFRDELGYFHPFVVIPFAMFYNPELLKENELPKRWEDLSERKWQGKIAIPDQHHMATKMIRAFMKTDYPETFLQFQENLVTEGGPLNVVNAVDEGRFPLGITNMTFSRISGNKKIEIIWPEDGFFCMPQIMVWRKNADKRLLEIGEFLLSKEVQEYLALQTFVPVSESVPIPSLLVEHHFNLRWKNWNTFLEAVKK